MREFRYSSGTVCAVVAGLLLLAAAGHGQIEVWTSRYDPGYNGDDCANAIALAPDSGVVTAGSCGALDGSDMALVRLGPAGQKLWARTYSAGAYDEALGVAVDDSGNVFVCGKSTTGADADYVTVKYDAAGVQQWANKYNNGTNDVAVAVAPDRAGGCFVTGYSRATNADYITFHYWAGGSVAWSARRDGAGLGDDYATALALSPSGELYVTGYSFASAVDSFDYCTVKYDTSNGSETWAQLYDGTAEESYDPKADYAFGMTVDASGNVYVTGRAGENDTRFDATTVKYNPAGGEVWVHRMNFGNHQNEGASKVAVDQDGYVYCGGYTTERHYDSGSDMLVYRIAPDGTTDWYDVYDFKTDMDDSTVALGIDQHSNVYVAGYSEGAVDGDPDWAVFKYSPRGELLWYTRHGVYDDYDEPTGLVVDRTGEPYVTGYDTYRAESEDMATVKYSEPDAGAGVVTRPVDTLRYDATVKPRVWVRNYGAVKLTFPVRLDIGAVYWDAQNVVDLAAYDSVPVEFKEWKVRDVGTLPIRCFTLLAGDKDPANDSCTGLVTTVPVWEPLTAMPTGPREKPVKDGGALSFARDTLVFGFKGNNTVEFYAYNTRTREWTAKETLSSHGSTGRTKRVKKGARLEWDQGNRIYALKGNGTYEFWRYSIEGDTGWAELDGYPSTTGRKVKAGAGLAWVPAQGLLYSCKGSNTDEFYAYNIGTKKWLTMKVVPGGDKNKRCKDGTCMAFDGDSTIYLVKGGGYEFYAYNVNRNTWATMKPLRNSFYSSRRRKMKNGADVAWDAQNRRLYATKGGKLSEFWYYDPAARDSWVETLDSIPRSATVPPPKNGSCMTYGNGKLYFLRGNKTRDFLVYHANFPLNPGGYGGPQTGLPVQPALPGPTLAASPNPFAWGTVLRFVVPQAGRVRLVLFDASGRRVTTLVDEWRAAGEYRATLQGRALAPGVYLAKLVTGSDLSSAATAKLVVAR